MPSYKTDKGLETLANQIIKDHRPNLGMLKIAYLFRDEAPVSDGKITCGMCYRADDRNRAVHGLDFIIEISKDIWDEATDQFKIALMDHELGHVGIRMQEDGTLEMDEKTLRIKTFVKKHDIEEFEEILERHGAYHKSLREFLAAFARHKTASKKKGKADAGDPTDGDDAE